MSAPAVLLDACTLYPAALRDVLMRLALHGLIAARWTDAIHDEWIEAVLRDRPDLTRARLQRTRDLMDLHAEGSLVTCYERRIKDLELPDVNDRHVLAAAIEGEAEVILTWNLRDFPGPTLASHGLRAATPDDLLTELIKGHRMEMIGILREARLSLKQPPLTAAEYLTTLQLQGLTSACGLLAPSLHELQRQPLLGGALWHLMRRGCGTFSEVPGELEDPAAASFLASGIPSGQIWRAALSGFPGPVRSLPIPG